jgi:hypothetical protein
VAPDSRPTAPGLKCSFCGRVQPGGVRGPKSADICRDCIALCHDVVHRSTIELPEGT